MATDFPEEPTMYIGNGITTEFPLPDGEDGKKVVISTPGPGSIKMAVVRDSAYTVVNGTVKFLTPPPVGTVISFNGETGDVYFKGEWDITSSYKQGDIVLYNGIYYMALDTSKSEQPDESSDFWTDNGVGNLSTRQEALEKRMSNLIAGATETDQNYAMEVIDGRIDSNESIHTSLGDNIRAIDRRSLKTTEFMDEHFFESEGSGYIYAILDAESNILAGITTDGDFYFGAGVPSQVSAALQSVLNELKGTIDEEISARETLGNNLNTTLSGLSDTVSNKVDKVAGKSLIDEEFAGGVSHSEGENLYSLEDAVGNEIQTVDSEGRTKIHLGLDVAGASFDETENQEYIYAITDSNGNVIAGINTDGNVDFGVLPLQVQQAIERVSDTLTRAIEAETAKREELAEEVKNKADEVQSQNEALDMLSVVSEPEYLFAVTDAEGKILEYIDTDGNKHFTGSVFSAGSGGEQETETGEGIKNFPDGISVSSSASATVTEDKEFIQVMTDADGKIIQSVDVEGNMNINVPLNFEKVNYTDSNLTDLEKALKQHGFTSGTGDWSDASSLQIPEPRLALVNITGISSMPTSKTTESKAFMEFWDLQGNYFKKKIICSAQGVASLAYPKKNMKFDICNGDLADNVWDDDDTFSLKIGSWVTQDSFHLKAYATDFFRGNGAVAYKFYDEIVRTRGITEDRPWKKELINISEIQVVKLSNNETELGLRIDTGALNHPDSFPCIVYLNGSFYGIFAWQLKKHRDNYHMVKDLAEHVHIDGLLREEEIWDAKVSWSAFEVRNPKNLYCMDGSEYDGDNPKELIDETSEFYDLETDKAKVKTRKQMSATVKKYILEFSTVMNNLKMLRGGYDESRSEEDLAALKTLFEKYFDIDNLVDYLIFQDVLGGRDAFIKNCQWTTYNGVKWYANVYDLDLIIGSYHNYNGGAPFTTHVYTSKQVWPYYLYTYYAAELEARYAQLRALGIIDAEHFISMLNDWIERVGFDNYEAEYKKWTDNANNVNKDSIYRAWKWLDKSVQNMDVLYKYKN